jgi:hypothetical protein
MNPSNRLSGDAGRTRLHLTAGYHPFQQRGTGNALGHAAKQHRYLVHVAIKAPSVKYSQRKKQKRGAQRRNQNPDSYDVRSIG